MPPATMDPWVELMTVARALRRPPAAGFEGQARRFEAELARWNQVARLTGYRTPAARVRHLLAESLLLLEVLPERASPLLDIGSGPGVPGLILKLARPEWHVILVEAKRRRANFLRHVVRELALVGAEIREARAEDLIGELGGRFRSVTARAVGPLENAVALARGFVAPDGCVVIPLGPVSEPAIGEVREVASPSGAGGLRPVRRVLIIPAGDLGGVPRETRGGRGADPGDRQPKGGRR